MGASKCVIPLNVQFELTYNCNNRCVFCYNSEMTNTYKEINTQEAILIIRDLASCGILSINFNGGEPLMRDDFFEIVKVADECGLDIHMNTNANLINEANIKNIAKYFPAVCTTILAPDAYTHDKLSGRKGAFQAAKRGIQLLQENSVYVAVNIMLSRLNIDEIYDTYDFLRSLDVRSVLITRYVPCKNNIKGLSITDQQFLDAIQKIYDYNVAHQCFDRIAFPQPFKLCHVSGKLQKQIADSNIACTIGLCTASISPNGDLTPCNLVKTPVLGNLLNEHINELWKRFDGETYFGKEHLESKCSTCTLLPSCGGGCKGYNDALKKGEFL